MIFFKKLFMLLSKIVIIPLICLITFDQSNLERAINARFTVKDYLIHSLVIVSSIAFYFALDYKIVNLDSVKVQNLLSDLIKLQGILLAATIAVTTFILNNLKPVFQNNTDTEAIQTVSDVVGDLKLVNRIIFWGFIFIIVLYLLSLSFHVVNNITIAFIFFFLLWSIMAIDSLIRNVFLFIMIK